MEKMTFQKVFNAVERGKYRVSKPEIPERWKANHVVDANESVSWNREHVKLHNAAVKQECLAYFKRCAEKSDEFKADVKKAICSEYGFSESMAEVIIKYLNYDFEYEGAAAAETTCEMLKEFLKCQNA
nr:hypothetical protein DGKKSRWO_DGKKSRWO_CDS_0029 [uncultured phage]CAI9752156.1 hypothetical protein CVNMHQAP_CVNMHQAP_CDS_0029 [uncultured phage]